MDPKLNVSKPSKTENPYQGRWRHWYPDIADWMIRNPGGKLKACALELNRGEVTISYIVRTDMFQEFLSQRREWWRRQHDQRIINRVTAVAEKSLDLLLDKMEKQGDKIPMQLVTEVATSALDRLGYAPKTGAAVEVNVNTDNRTQVLIPMSPAALEEARDAIRVAEQKKAIEQREMLELEAEPQDAASPVSTERNDDSSGT